MLGTSVDAQPRRLMVPTIIALIAIVAALLPHQAKADSSRSHLVVHGTIGSFSVNPNLNLTFTVDKSSAIPGDTLTYSGTVTHTGVTACLPGTFTAQNTGTATATIADFFDEIDEWDPNQLKWVPLAGTTFTRQAFVPVVTPLISTGITLTVTSVAANGVTYPSSGNPVIGTTIAPNATAAWNGKACITLTAAQLQTLANATSIRVQEHFEDTPGDSAGEQWTDNEQCPSPFNLGALAAKNVVVTVTPPSGSAVQITSNQVPAFSSLAVGASANYSTTYKVPAATARGGSETEPNYVQRLTGLEGSSLNASASVSGTGPTGAIPPSAPITAPTTLHVPIVTIAKSGPAQVTAGTTATYPLALKNSGQAPASGIVVADTVPAPGGATSTISGAPTTLAGGASSSGVQATFAVPPSQSQGNLTDTATVNWQDANGNNYGQLSSSFTTIVLNPLLGAKFTLALPPGSAGLSPINASQSVLITLLNSAGAPIPNQSVTINVTGANPTSLTAVTDSNGQATVSYIGKTSGVDQLQGTASAASVTVLSNTVSVTWINPIEPISTTPVQGTFFAENATAQSFVAKPGDSAAFQQTFPTINFNPPANVVPHNIAGVSPTTTPFTDVTTDAVGNFAGTIVAQGNGLQAGTGTMANFDAVLAGTFVVSQAQDVTLKVIADDGFIVGVGGGATYVSGPLTNPPASTAFSNYPVVGAYNTGGATAPATYTLTIHFPAAGTYPYELDYFECCANQMSLTVTVVSVNAGPYNLYTGYGDTVRPAGTSSFPYPWKDSSNTTFIGDGAPYDTGALRFDNNTNQPITLNKVTVDIGTHYYDPWNRNLTVPANGTLILASSANSFDTSEANGTLKSGGGGGSAGFTATQWATGFQNCGGVGPVGVAFDSAGNLFVMNYCTGFLYKFGSGGGAANAATQVNANAIYGCPAGLAFSKDGKHLFLARRCNGDVLEVDPGTGNVLRTVATNLPAATGIATDPQSGDLFVSEPNGGSGIFRIPNPTSAAPGAPVLYTATNADGIAFGPDGTLYGAVYGQGVAIMNGTNTSSPGTITTQIINGNTLAGTDGIALLPPPAGSTDSPIVLNSNNGFIVEIDNPRTNPTFHNLVTGGSRGDFATVGPDGCLYATQTSSVEKVTASDGSCPFIPSICLPNSTVPQVHVTINGAVFNYNDAGLALTNAGIDGECNGTNESQAWQQIDQGKAGPINIPLPPSMTLALQAAPSTGHIVGQSQAFTVAAMDGAGHAVPNVGVQLAISGANPNQLSATTDQNGTATFSYTSKNAGTDTIGATAFVSGLRTVSNAATIQWSIPIPGGPTGSTSGPAPPSVVITSPADGSQINVPTAVTATVTPPASSPLASWSVTYQNVTGGTTPTILNSGNGAPPASLTTFDPSSLAAGTYAITVNAATTVGGGASAVTRVIVGGSAGAGTAAQAPPTISAPSPADGTIVTKPVPIVASVTPPSGQSITSWSVWYQAQDVEPAVTLASGTGTPPATLATFDPTLLSNDTYIIAVTATASGGGTQTATTTVAVNGNLKLGRYVTAFQDLNVPVNGFQMEVRRVYDSIDKRVGDFGFGWHVDVANFRVSANRVLGAGGWTLYPTQCIFGLCFYAFKTSAPHYVTVTFPDGHQEIFDFTPQGGAGILYWQGNAAFTPRAGTRTTSTLEVVGDSGLSYDFAGNLTGSSGYYNATRFKLTTHDGQVLILDTVLGLVSETDRHGNSLNVDANGVHTSNGQSITYTRDASGRVSKITGPSNQVISYSYSAAGDLASSTNPNNNTTTYSYDANHNLLSMTGPAQTRPISTLAYDSSGRIVSVTDGNGSTTQINNNVPGQQQTVTDATGKLTTISTLDNLGDILRQDQVFDGKTLTTTATYDSVGRPLSKTDPLGRTWTGSYNAGGDLLQLSTPQTNTVGITYDSNDLPLTYSDPLGNVTKYAYDASGNLTTDTNPLGQANTYTYDAQGNLSSRTDALNNKWTYTHDSAGHQTSMTDPLGNVTKYSYDASGNLTSTTDPTGAVMAYTYDAEGNLTSTKDPLGQLTSIAYDSLGRISSRTDPSGNKTVYGYDGNNALSSVTDPLGRVTRYGYDADGRLTTMTDPNGGVMTYGYDGAGRRVSETDAIGRVTSYSYDGAGRLVSKTMPNGGAFTYAYNADGYQTSVTDPLGHTTSTAYDANGNMTSKTDALGKVTTFTFDALGRITKTVDPLGQVSTQAYDATGRITSSTDPLGHATSYSYDALGNRLGITDPLGHTTSSAYDADGRLVTSTDALGRSATLAYDSAGRLTSTTTPAGNVTTYKYDALGRETSVSDPLGNTGTYAYDAAGQRTSATDPRGNSTTYGYDAAGHLTTITDALGGKITLTVDASGQQTAITNPRGDTTRFTYDSLGNPATQTDPAGGVTNFAYDAAGRLVSKTDARGINVASGYDADNRLISTTFPGGSISQAYDELGRRTSMTDPLGTTSYSYDSSSNVTAVAAPQGTVTYAYDAAGRRTAMTLPGSRTVTYAYDSGNELTSLTDWLGQTSTFNYNSDGLVTGISRPGGLQTAYSYDSADRVTSVNNDGPGGALKHFSYTLDPNGNRTSVTTAAGTESYTLDALNRITSAAYPNGDKATYTYDPAGNRTSQTVNGVTTNYSYDAGGRLVQAGATTYRYDAAGNLIGAGADSFSWDWAGRLTQATVGGTTSSSSYDGDGLRTASQVGTSSSSYVWDRQQSLPQLVDDGSKGYVQTSESGLLEQVDNGGTSTAMYPLLDALGSIRGMANSSGALTGSTDFDIFGAARSTSGSSSVFGFTGQQTDPTGLIYLRARYLSPLIGRFLSPDSVFPSQAGTQGYNLYAYAGNNPTTWVDPSGHQFALNYGKILALLAAAAVATLRVLATFIVRHLVAIIAGLMITAAAGCLLGLSPERNLISACQGPSAWWPASPRAGPTAPALPTAVAVPTAIAVPTTAPTPRSTDNRGRIQAQGSGLQVSQPWNQPTPPTATQGVGLLDLVWSQLSRREQSQRDQAYARLKAFILSRPPIGITAPYSNTWTNSGVSGTVARLDLEVITGQAFVEP